MRLSATQDVPDAELRSLAHDLQDLAAIEVDEARAFHRSAEPPSWIALFEHIPTWAAVLGPSAAVFLQELLKEAAKDAYRNKAAIAHALASPVVRPLRVAAGAITRFRRTAGRTQVEVGVPSPDDYFGTRLRLDGQDEESIALELALFVKQCGAIAAVLEEAQRGGTKVIGQVSLTLLPDGGMRAQWMDRDARTRSATLPPPAP